MEDYPITFVPTEAVCVVKYGERSAKHCGNLDSATRHILKEFGQVELIRFRSKSLDIEIGAVCPLSQRDLPRHQKTVLAWVFQRDHWLTILRACYDIARREIQ